MTEHNEPVGPVDASVYPRYAGIATFAATTAGFFASARKNYRRWRDRTVVEADAILDRLEKGDELRPPPAPWIRKLQLKFGQL